MENATSAQSVGRLLIAILGKPESDANTHTVGLLVHCDCEKNIEAPGQSVDKLKTLQSVLDGDFQQLEKLKGAKLKRKTHQKTPGGQCEHISSSNKTPI